MKGKTLKQCEIDIFSEVTPDWPNDRHLLPMPALWFAWG